MRGISVCCSKGLGQGCRVPGARALNRLRENVKNAVCCSQGLGQESRVHGPRGQNA